MRRRGNCRRPPELIRPTRLRGRSWSILLTKQAEAKKEHTEAIQKALKAREEENQPAAVKLQPFPQEPLAHFRLSADSIRVYQTLGKLAGHKRRFHPGLSPAAPLSEDLSGVTIEDALKLVAMQSKSFWKAVTPNTILVIPDNPNNRRDYDEEVVKTIYLSNPLAPADRTAITTALKQVSGFAEDYGQSRFQRHHHSRYSGESGGGGTAGAAIGSVQSGNHD